MSSLPLLLGSSGPVDSLSILLRICRNGEHFRVELKDAPPWFLLPNFSRAPFCFLPPVNLDFSSFFLLLSLFVFILFLLGLFGLLIPSFIGCCSSGLHHSRIFRLLPVSGRELQTRTRCDDRCRRITSARSQGPTKSTGRCVSRSTHFAVRGL